jgi:RNA polymerase sigma-70 factor (ECF subfamily)
MTDSEFEDLMTLHQAEIYRYLRYLGAGESSAEDLAQETFIRAYRSLEKLESDDDRGRAAWLRGIARNVFLMDCRNKKRNPVRFDSRQLDEAESFWKENFLRGGDGFDLIEALRECLKKLPVKQREVIDRHYSAGESRKEIACFLGITEDGVKILLRRIRAALGKCVEGRGEEGLA